MNPSQMTDDLPQSGQELRQRSSEAVNKARDGACEVHDRACDAIRRCPLTSVLVAAAAGVAVGWLLGTSGRAPWHEQALEDLRGNAGDAVDKLRNNLRFW